ncbi:type IV pilus biogenesis complex ATPase subunit [Salinarchaeum sp. Harcht-Bsk1]|uniref:ATPase, T2SS/T4P/T4SS family n=1 Tax=Salinarchaeum sp. Harcht-Bsk1 TaxID=1333523 RepID=UPI0003423A80|nr:ATPase, T2SS/T4P/T4SS family [Salinarchaeum sp. Harcht-Bsk1]AGN02034.1 type IV pilus biogenesis complex ATPase subunit [Salinarchaeum sp. Harcht-Bsk1]
MQDLLDRLFGAGLDSGCACSVSTDGATLAVDATDCDGRLASAPACRAAIADELCTHDVERIRVRSSGVDRYYDEDAVGLLNAAGRFAALAREADPDLAERARTEPLAAAADAGARAPPISAIAAEVGLLDAVRDDDADPFQPAIAPSVADARVRTALPPDAQLRTARELPTGATVRIYDAPGEGAATYHLDPAESDLDESALATLADAYELLAERSDEPAPVAAVRSALEHGTAASRSSPTGDGHDRGYALVDGRPADDGSADPARTDAAPADPARTDDADVRTLAAVLRKHTRGFGVLEDCFADPAVSDVYASGPAAGTPLWVVADGEQLRTNILLGEDGVGAIASTLRRRSGRSFSRASPTLDATAEIAEQTVRVAGVLDPATEGHAFAFRSGGEEAFTLPALVANGTLPPAAAGLLSVAVRRSAAGLLAGTRGAGKTTALGALLWELPATTRSIVIEDTPELPVATYQDRGRDVQPLHTTLEEGPGVTPTEALRTALRLGESAIVLGEVRGEEAAVLYEAMRVGASGETVLGTIHGDGGEDVRERVVGDVGVPESSFGATDLVVTCESYRRPDGERARRVAAIEEVIRGEDGVRFASLFELETAASATDGRARLVPTGRIDRGNSRLLQALTRPGESYAVLREQIDARAEFVGSLADRGTTAPAAVTTAYARRGDGPC